jgi:hypothetical protein
MKGTTSPARIAQIALVATLAAVAAAGLAPTGSQAADPAVTDEFIPFVTDFPKPAAPFVPFVTDFPKPGADQARKELYR